MLRHGTLRITVACASALALLVLAVPAGVATGTANPSRSHALTTAELASGADHDCVVSGSTPRVAWSQLRNPILSYRAAGVKDEQLIWADGKWHMLFSYMTHDPADPGGVHWNVATSTSTDLTRWSAPSPWPAQTGTLGVAAPKIVRSPTGRWVVSYQGNPEATAQTQDKIYYRTSADLVHWSPAHPLARSLAPAPADRQIDASLAFTGHGLILGYKASRGTDAASSGQAFTIAWSPNGSLNGPWKLIGRPDISIYGGTIESYEFVSVGGRWHLVATTNNLDQPWIFQLTGNPSEPSSWLHWTGGRELSVPIQAWDGGSGIPSVAYEPANSAFLCNATRGGGYYYLLYSGSNELSQFDGWGHAEIGIARSTDLEHWQVPAPAG